MGVLADLDQVTALLEAAVGGLDAAVLSGDDAAVLVETFARSERLCAAGKALAARRAAETRVWCAAGERSAAYWLARRTGTTLGAAAAAIETAERLDDLAATDEAFRSGRLSEVQAREITSVAAGRPDTEAGLVARAASDTVAGLRQACRQAAAVSGVDELSRDQAVHRGRYLKSWVDAYGAARLVARMTVADMAKVVAAVDAFEPDIFDAARRCGRREPYHAYRADALVAMAAAAAAGAGAGGSSTGGPVATGVVLADHGALVRGWAEPGESCEIAGVGPVPVATAKAMMADAFLAAVVTDGVDVYTVAHLGRSVTAHQRTALAVRDRECVVEGCHVTRHLEIDHVDGWANTGITKLDRLVRLCHFHHAQKTYDGYQLTGSPGHWQWTAPTPPPCP